MCLGSKFKINDFILEDRTKIPLILEHGVLGIKIDTNLNFYSQTNLQLPINLMH